MKIRFIVIITALCILLVCIWGPWKLVGRALLTLSPIRRAAYATSDLKDFNLLKGIAFKIPSEFNFGAEDSKRYRQQNFIIPWKMEGEIGFRFPTLANYVFKTDTPGRAPSMPSGIELDISGDYVTPQMERANPYQRDERVNDVYGLPGINGVVAYYYGSFESSIEPSKHNDFVSHIHVGIKSGDASQKAKMNEILQIIKRSIQIK